MSKLFRPSVCAAGFVTALACSPAIAHAPLIIPIRPHFAPIIRTLHAKNLANIKVVESQLSVKKNLRDLLRIGPSSGQANALLKNEPLTNDYIGRYLARIEAEDIREFESRARYPVGVHGLKHDVPVFAAAKAKVPAGPPLTPEELEKQQLESLFDALPHLYR